MTTNKEHKGLHKHLNAMFFGTFLTDSVVPFLADANYSFYRLNLR